MVSILVVSPVGTSLFRNFSSSPRFRAVVEKFGVGDWVSMSLSDSRNAYPSGEVCRSLGRAELTSSLADFISADPESSCAELAGFYEVYRDARTRYGVVEVAVVSLYPTASCTSYLASEVIAKYLRSQGFGVAVRVVEAIRSEEEFDGGLASLVDVVAEDLVEYGKKGFKVYVNATPGFKPEATFLVLLALLLGVNSVYYIHEAFKSAVRLPTIPISIRGEYLEILRKLASEGGLELSYAYSTMGLTESYIKELEDRYLVYIDGATVKPRKWVTKLVQKLERKNLRPLLEALKNREQ